MKRESFFIVKKITVVMLLFAILLSGFRMPIQVKADVDTIGKLFKKPSTEYNNDLAYFAAELCDKAQGKSSENIEKTLDKYGIKKWPYNYEKSAAFVIGHKKVKIEGEGDATVLVVIARGTVTNSEKIGDVFKGVKNKNLFGERVLKNVCDFENELWKGWKDYIDRNRELNYEKNVKILVTGHSLGGAAANLMAARMDYWINNKDWVENISKDDVYCYTFGAIKVLAENKNVKKGYENILNIYNKFDTFGPNGNNRLKNFKVSHPKAKFGITLEYDKLHDEEKSSLMPTSNTSNNHNMGGNYKKAVELGIVKEVAESMGLIDIKDSNIKIGSKIYFGHYEQDEDEGNGKEPIEWQVLDKKANKVLLISTKLLDAQHYPREGGYTWEESTLRKWLNTEFIKEAFNYNESQKILDSDIKNDNNKKHGTKGGNDTKDKIFLLSIDEAEKYFKTNKERIAEVTNYTIKRLAGGNSEWEKYLKENQFSRSMVAWYYLRSPGIYQHHLASVTCSGEVYSGEAGFNSSEPGSIRPALWISCEVAN